MPPVPSLTRWGVSPQAELVYRTLTTLGPHRIGEINQSLDLPAQTVRSALDELYAVGGVAPDCAPRRADDRLWMASAPQTFVAVLKERREREARAAQAFRDMLDGTGVPIPEDQLQRHHLLGTVQPLYGVPKTRDRIAELNAAAQHELWSMSPQTGFAADSRRAAAPNARALALRGVPSWGLFIPAVYEDDSAEYDEIENQNTQDRSLPELPLKLMIFDRRAAIIPLDPADYYKGAWEITDRSIMDTLVSLFLQRWERAKPVAPRLRQPQLSTRETDIISLMAQGHTDEVIAARLSISGRSISYAIARLMDRYNARNRFQLGLLLGAQSTRQQQQTGKLTGTETGTIESTNGEAT